MGSSSKGETVALKVIGAGLPRTGTMSLMTALEQPGFGPTMHMVKCQGNWSLTQAFVDAQNGKKVDFAAALTGFGSGCDSPFSDNWKAIAEQFPEAKVVLTYRDGEAWIKSFESTVKTSETLLWELATVWFPPMWQITRVAQASYTRWRREYGAIDASVMAKRVQGVKQGIPPGRLLVWQVSEGWEPLCKFLGVPVPDTPFPRVNDGLTMQRAFNVIRTIGSAIWAGVFVAAVMAGPTLLGGGLVAGAAALAFAQRKYVKN